MIPNIKKPHAVLFDLDGTFVDTAPDLAEALNHVLISENKEPLEFDAIRRVCSDGARGLLTLGFGEDVNNNVPKFTVLREKLLTHYFNHIAEKSCLFPGITDYIQYLNNNTISWGIVTNKPDYLTQKLLTLLNLAISPGCVVSGDTLLKAKPDPEPLLYAAKLLGVSPENCWYIGDAKRDMVAANRAAMVSIVALYGYVNDDYKNWEARYAIHSVSDLYLI